MYDSGGTTLEAGSDAPPDSGVVDVAAFDASGWSLIYDAGGGIQTVFFRESGAPIGPFAGDCYSQTQTATVAPAGTDFTVTPMPGCYDGQGNPCIYCGPMGQCASGTTVPLTRTGSGPTWEGRCGLYTVTLQAQ
jgi:hypothetical protein